MIVEQFGKEARIAARRHEAGAEDPRQDSESHTERPYHVARCAFEIVGVTVRPRAVMASHDIRDTEESDTDRMLSSLVAALDPGQAVTFVYEGGGHAPLRWMIVTEAKSAESNSRATECLHSIRQAVMAVLKSRRAYYRFKPTGVEATDRPHTSRNDWIGTIQPQGTRVKQVRNPVGFRDPSDLPEMSDTAVCLPHYVQDRAKAFGSVVNLLMSSHIPLRMSVTLEACRLNRVQERSLKSALDVILDRTADSEIPAHLESSASIWLKTLAGCRITCSVISRRAVSDSFLRMLGGELYHCPVDVACRRKSSTLLTSRTEISERRDQILDLRECIPSSAPLPPLFPQPEALARHGMRRFFNRDRPVLPRTGSVIGLVEDGHADQPVRLCRKERSRHLYILGATGTGKSTLLYNLIMQDIDGGEGVCLVDPHGDLFQQVLRAIPPHRADDVILLDPSDRQRAVGINLLDCEGPHREAQAQFVINEVLAILEKLYDMRTCGGPMFEQYFRGALQLVMSVSDSMATLVEMSPVFEHKAFRDALLKKCDDPLLADFWKMAENAGGEPRLANIAPYIVCKLNQFVHNAMLRPIIGQTKSTVDFRAIMDQRRILLVNLSRGALGELDMRLLGMVVLTKLICAAMSRLGVAASRRKPFMVYVDEFQNFTTDATASLLSESRKFGLCLTLANQNLAQLSAGKGQENLVHSVLGNVGSMVLFRLGAPDAEKLAMYTRPQFGPEELQTLANFHAASRILTPTGPTNPFVFKTYPAGRRKPEAAVLQRVGRAQCKYTTSIKAVEEEIRKRRESIRAMGESSGGKKPASGASGKA